MTSIKRLILGLAAGAARLLPMPVKRWLYQSPLLAGFIRRSLNKAAPGGITSVKVAGGILKGARLCLDLQTEKDYWLGTYEPDLQYAARDFVKKGMVVFDVGANIGYISLLAARLVGQSGRIFAFEALPANIDRLKENLAANSWASQAQVIHAAVTDSMGQATFLVHPSGAMGKTVESTGRQADYSQRIQVPSISLDHFVFEQGNPHPQLVKMDIEGGEGLALLGMARILQKIRPLLLIELHGQQAAQQVWENLRRHGYSMHRMQKGYEQIADVQALDWKAYVVAIPQE